MPDICMCDGYDCKKKDECYRHVAVPSQCLQSYLLGDPRKKDGECLYFMPIRGKTEKKYGKINE